MFEARLKVPLIAAPMFTISTLELVKHVCAAGAIGAIPASNSRTLQDLDGTLEELRAFTAERADGVRLPPYCVNLIIQQPRLFEEVDLIIKHRTEMVITSVGSPKDVVRPLHQVGCAVFADVVSLKQARRALASGVDGLVLLTAGGGGQTGWANPFAFVRAVRSFFDGPIVLSGGISDGAALWAAKVLGCDFGYMGTRFVASRESFAKEAYKQMLVSASLDDVFVTKAFTGLETSMLRPSVVAAGLDPASLNESVTPQSAKEIYGGGDADQPRRWTDIWSAGHSVSSVHDVLPAAEIVARTAAEYAEARVRTLALCG
jgi:nitronate monooxygenase